MQSCDIVATVGGGVRDRRGVVGGFAAEPGR